jgi:AhpD family alkylhydroperoxidase
LEVEEECEGRSVMETKTKLLIMVGAAVTANCQPCLRTLIKKACEIGVDRKEISEAIGVAKAVRKSSMTQIDRFVSTLTGNTDAEMDSKSECGCSSPHVKTLEKQEVKK